MQLKDLEKQLAQSATEARDAQNERDIAIKQSGASQRQLDSQAQDVLKYKSSVRCFLLLSPDTLESRCAAHASRAHGGRCPLPPLFFVVWTCITGSKSSRRHRPAAKRSQPLERTGPELARSFHPRRRGEMFAVYQARRNLVPGTRRLIPYSLNSQCATSSHYPASSYLLT